MIVPVLVRPGQPTGMESEVVMAGLVPAIHVLLARDAKKDVDARHKAGHDGANGDTHAEHETSRRHRRRCHRG